MPPTSVTNEAMADIHNRADDMSMIMTPTLSPLPRGLISGLNG